MINVTGNKDTSNLDWGKIITKRTVEDFCIQETDDRNRDKESGLEKRKEGLCLRHTD